jgi:hypothetical protein
MNYSFIAMWALIIIANIWFASNNGIISLGMGLLAGAGSIFFAFKTNKEI